MKSAVQKFIGISPFFPENINTVIEFLKRSGFSGHAFRTQSRDFAEALPTDDIAIRHFLAFCDQGQSNFPIDLNLDGYRELTRARIWDRVYFAHILSNLLNAHLITHPDAAYDPEFWSATIPALRRISRPYLIIGDSHSQISCAVGTSLYKPIFPIHVSCTGGSAVGLSRETSRSRYGLHITRLISALSSTQTYRNIPIWFQFGQVDLEFVYNFRRVKNHELDFDEENFERFCEEVISGYLKFLRLAKNLHANINVLSVFPPILSDAALSAGYMNAHIAYLESELEGAAMRRSLQALTMPGLHERTGAHRAFNRKLQTRCAENGINFLDTFDRFLGKTGLVAGRFATHSDQDHHMDVAAARPCMRDALERAMVRAVPWR